MVLPSPQLSSTTKDALLRPFIHFNVIEGFQVARKHPQYATPNLSKWFRKNRKLGSRDRKVVSEIIYTLIRFQQLLLSCGFESIEEQLLALGNDSPLQFQADFIEQATAHLSIPKWLTEQWYSVLGDEISELATFLQGRAPIDIRVNALRHTRKKLIQRLHRSDIPCCPIENTDWGIRIDGRAHLLSLAEYKQGAFEIQDAASQIFCEQLKLKKGEHVFDFCSGAGGKALAFASQGATVYATDPRTHAITELRKRAQRSRLKIHLSPPSKLVETVVVDAPCSGSGRLRREPAIRWRWQQQDILQHCELQRQLLQEASQHVAPEGRLIYATCSLLQQENEHPLDGWKKEETTYLWPHRWNCDGFAWTTYRRYR